MTDPVETITFRDIKNFTAGPFLNSLSEVPWESSFIFDDPNDQYEHFLSLLTDVIDEHAPMKTVKTKAKQDKLPYLTKELKAMIKTKNLLNKQSRKDSSLIPLFKDMRRCVKKATREAEKLFYEDALKTNKNNPKKMWQILNKSSGFRTPKTRSMTIQSTTDAKSFNNFFTNVPNDVKKELAETMDRFRLDKKWTQGETPPPPPFEMRSATTDDIAQIISKLDTTKAIGHDNISALFLRAGQSVLSPIITKIINSCIEQGIFPQTQKIARVIPIHKKGDLKKPGNHRPVSILSSISKVFERYLADRICEHVDEHMLLNNHQSGFRKKH